MSASNDSTARRPESLVGVCAAIGEDFGFNPDFLRVPLAACLLFAPMMVAIAYGGLALAVLASRLLFPSRRALPASATIVAIRPETDTADRTAVPEMLREAA